MIHQPNVGAQKATSESAAQDSLEQTVSEYILASKFINKQSDAVARIRDGGIPASRLHTMEVEATECLRLSAPSTIQERFLDTFGSSSPRQAALVSRASQIREDFLAAKLTNATLSLEAARLVTSAQVELFSMNFSLHRSIGLLTTYVLLDDLQHSRWENFHKASYRLDEEARAQFASFGLKKDANGWIPEENYWAIKNAQNVLLTCGSIARRQVAHRLQHAIVASIPFMDALHDAAITSKDRKVIIPCNLGGEALQRSARELSEQLELFLSPQSNEDTQIKALIESDKLTDHVVRLASVALEHVANTEDGIRRSIQKTLFPDMKGLPSLEKLYS